MSASTSGPPLDERPIVMKALELINLLSSIMIDDVRHSGEWRELVQRMKPLMDEICEEILIWTDWDAA